MFILVIVPSVVSFLLRWFELIWFISSCCGGKVFVRISRMMIPRREIESVSFVTMLMDRWVESFIKVLLLFL